VALFAFIVLIIAVFLLALVLGYFLSLATKMMILKRLEAKVKSLEEQAKVRIKTLSNESKLEISQMRREFANEVDRKRRELLKSEKFYEIRENNLQERELLVNNKEEKLLDLRKLLMQKKWEYQKKMAYMVEELEKLSSYKREEAKAVLFEKIK